MEFMPIRSVFGRIIHSMPLLLLLATEKIKMLRKKEVQRDHLCQKVGQLKIQVDWLKKDRLSGMSVSGKVICIDSNEKKLSISW
jgi:hypothetical protein